jgi:hypothetical protein
MTMRHMDEASKPRQPRRDCAQARERRTSAPLQPWMCLVPWFLAQFEMPENLTYGQKVNDATGEPEDTFLSARDGSWCEVSANEDNGTRRVIEACPARYGACSNRPTSSGAPPGSPVGTGSD